MTNKDVYQSGNTIRLTCEFFDFDGLKKDPQIIKVKIYDYKYNVISEITNVERIDIGKYYLDYIAEGENKKHYYEWYAEIDGTPSLKRSSFTTRFV